MNMEAFYRAVLDQDRAPVVLCDLNDTIIYMNETAKQRYAKEGGGDLVGKSLLGCHNPKSAEMIHRVVAWFAADVSHNIIYTFRNPKENKDVYMVALRDADGTLIGYYEKHEYRTAETMPLYGMH